MRRCFDRHVLSNDSWASFLSSLAVVDYWKPAHEGGGHGMVWRKLFFRLCVLDTHV